VSSTARPDAQGEVMTTRKKILLVDDADTILLMERMILSKVYDIATAKDGEEAVQKASSEAPDLILLDVVMPKMDGYQACQAIRQQEQTKNIPIIMVTTRGEAGSVEAGFKNGCTDYITKPINSLELLSKVRNYIGG
jgi:PleD family two-component response regulator